MSGCETSPSCNPKPCMPSGIGERGKRERERERAQKGWMIEGGAQIQYSQEGGMKGKQQEHKDKEKKFLKCRNYEKA